MTLPYIQTLQIRGNAATYEIGPLEPGYGTTIGNALIRTLRSLPGAAIVAMRIGGNDGNCQTMAGVREDIATITLNLKQVRLRCFSQCPGSILLNVSGKREVSASDIRVPDSIDIINPEVHIATLEQEDAHLTLEMMVQKGKGYVPAEAQTEHPLAEGILLDAVYTPVRKINSTVEHIRVGKMVNFEKIVLEIETDGTIPPDEALRQSAKILIQQFRIFMGTKVSTVIQKASGPASAVAIPWHVYELPLVKLFLPPRIYYSFKRRNITKVGQILTMNEEEFRSIRNIGEKSIPTVIAALRTAGCFLGIDSLPAPCTPQQKE